MIKIKKMNQKGMLDDFFDLIFTVVMALLLFFLIQGMLVGGDSKRNDDVSNAAKGVNSAFNLITYERINLEEGKAIDFVTLNQDRKKIQKEDFLTGDGHTFISGGGE